MKVDVKRELGFGSLYKVASIGLSQPKSDNESDEERKMQMATELD